MAAALEIRRDDKVADDAEAISPSGLEMLFHLPDGAAILDASGTILALNPAGRAVLGDPLHTCGVHWRDLAQPIDEADAVALSSVAKARGRTSRGTVDVTLHNGVRVSLAISVGPWPRGDYSVLSFRDVTQERTLDNELRRTTDFLEHLIESSSDAIVAADLEGRLIVYNRAAERLFGIPAGEARGKLNIAQLYPTGGAHEVMRLLRDSPTGHIEAVRAYGQARTGDPVPVELSAALLKMNGKEIGSVGLLRDIRERVRVEGELARTRARLIDAEKQRDIAALAGATAHELNQPLTVIFGRVDLLLRRAEEPQRSHLQGIAEQAERMAEIVKRIANLTHIRAVAYPGERIIADLSSQRDPGD